MKETNNDNTLHIPSREELHRTFGGKIHLSDFNTDYRGNDHAHGSAVAARIAVDRSWEQKLRTEKEWRRSIHNKNDSHCSTESKYPTNLTGEVSNARYTN